MPEEILPAATNVAKAPRGSVLGLIIATIALLAAGAAIAINLTMKPDTSALKAEINALKMDAERNAEIPQEDVIEEKMEDGNETTQKLDIFYSLQGSQELGHSITISYPHTWQATKEEVGSEGRPVVTLTSQRGLLVYAVSSGGPLPNDREYFYKGIQIDLKQLAEGESMLPDATLEKTSTDKLMKVTDPCDGAGCPAARYFFDGDYYIEVRYSDESYKELAEQVVESLK